MRRVSLVVPTPDVDPDPGLSGFRSPRVKVVRVVPTSPPERARPDCLHGPQRNQPHNDLVIPVR